MLVIIAFQKWNDKLLSQNQMQSSTYSRNMTLWLPASVARIQDTLGHRNCGRH